MIDAGLGPCVLAPLGPVLDLAFLPLVAVGGTGVVGTSTHFTGAATKQWLELYDAGRHEEALAVYRSVLDVYTGVFATQGCMLVKAGLEARGFAPATLRRPLKPASAAETAAFVDLLAAAGL